MQSLVRSCIFVEAIFRTLLLFERSAFVALLLDLDSAVWSGMGLSRCSIIATRRSSLGCCRTSRHGAPQGRRSKRNGSASSRSRVRARRLAPAIGSGELLDPARIL